MSTFSSRGRPGDALRVAIALLVHVPFAIAATRVPALATAHALITIAVGVAVALFARQRVQIAYVAAYIVGAEVLWRILYADVPWEIGKYGLSLVLLLGILRAPRARGAFLPMSYLALLLPSAVITIGAVGLVGARRDLSFNLSGPFALAISAWFFAQLELGADQVRRLCVAALAPIVGVAAVATFGIATSTDLEFTTQSNEALSGGALPVQVSSVLGLGALLALFCVVGLRSQRGGRPVFFLIAVGLAAQSAMTFSRGGLYCAAGAALVAALFLLTDAGARMRLLLAAVLLFLAGRYVVLPKLDEFTGGMLSARFQSTSLTGRDRIIATDLRIFSEHPLLGVGPGRAPEERERILGRAFAAHTEYARALAEHGVTGVMALLVLAVLAVRNVLRARDPVARAVAAGCVAWSLLFMASDGMRLAAPGFILGIASATLLLGARAPSPTVRTVAAGRLDVARA